MFNTFFRSKNYRGLHINRLNNFAKFYFRENVWEKSLSSKSVYSRMSSFNVSASYNYLRQFFRISYELIFVQIYLYSICKFHTVDPCLSAACKRKQNQFIICTTDFSSDYVQKSRFCRKKAVHCGGALLKNRKCFSLYILNGQRYRKNFKQIPVPGTKGRHLKNF